MTNDTSNLTQQVEEAREKARDHAVGGPDAFTWLDRLIRLERAEAVWNDHYDAHTDRARPRQGCQVALEAAIKAIKEAHHDQ